MQSFFSDAQWRWVKMRYDEGYSMEVLAGFLGIDRRSIRAGFVRLGFYPEKKSDLPPLGERAAEFHALAAAETPVLVKAEEAGA